MLVTSHDWNNPEEIREWDEYGDNFNPTRTEQLDLLVSILAASCLSQTTPHVSVASPAPPANWILDLGYGSGKVEQLIFERISGVNILGVDSSKAMMELAEKRLQPYIGQFEALQFDLNHLASLTLPAHPFQCVIAVQSLHHLSSVQLRTAYEWIYQQLKSGGVFLLLDRVQVETAVLWQVMQAVWRRQDQIYGSTVMMHEGKDFNEHEQIVYARGDFPVRIDDHLSWLRDCGFAATCVHAHGNRALIVGVK